MDPIEILDIFANDGFSAETLTSAVNTLPFVPGRVGQMDIFEEDGVSTTSIALEELDGTISLIPNTPRGGPASQNKKDKRTLRSLVVPHFPLEDTIKASEVQNIRPFGGGSPLMAVQDLVKRRMGRMMSAHDATVEYQRLGALKGILLDSDGATVIYNLFTEFGVNQTTVDFLLGTATTDVEGMCETVSANTETVLGAAMYDHIHVLCGKTFWRELITHPKVVTSYLYYQQTDGLNPLREDLRYKGFKFGGLVFEQYRGTVGGVKFVADGEAYAFPVGVPGMFITRYAPAEYLDTVNTMGLPRYARVFVDPKQRWVEVDTESNPISVCTRPAALNKLITSN